MGLFFIISELIRGIHSEEGETLFKDLITYMIVRQTSAMQYYADFSWSHLISSKKHWDDTRIRYFQIYYDNVRASRERNEYLDQLGFFVIVTSQKMSASEALDIYRKRDSVEKIFRMLKL